MKETKNKIKDLREQVEKMLKEGVATKERLLLALPLLIEFQEALAAARRSQRVCSEAAKALSEACTRYVQNHPSVLEAGHLVPDQNGVLTGDIIIDDADYHLACGYDGYMRTDGGMCTQDFLATLPAAWIKPNLRLSSTAINAANPGEEALAEAGLTGRPNNVWSLREE